MIERSIERFGLYPARPLGDSAYGAADMLGWLSTSATEHRHMRARCP
jgi:hypothetical protein